MEDIKDIAKTLQLIDSLYLAGSWCGETNIQKTIYLAQAITKINFNYNFILYKHGPFSFELRSDLASFRAEGFLSFVTDVKYGPRLIVTPIGKKIISHFPKTIKEVTDKFDFIIKNFGQKKVTELERLGTACMITLEKPNVEKSSRAEELIKLKPHISKTDAIAALDEIDHSLEMSLK